MLIRLVAAVALFGAPPLVGYLAGTLRPPAVPLAFRRIDALVAIGLVAQFVPVAHAVLLPGSYLLLLVWAVLRVLGTRAPLHRAIFALVGLAGALNALPILLNGAMPYTLRPGQAVRNGLKGIPIDDHTRLPFLGDVIPFLGKLVSPGDIGLAIGVALLVYAAMRPVPQPVEAPVATAGPWRAEGHEHA